MAVASPLPRPMVHTLYMDSIAPVLIPAIAALVGIVITALVTYLVGQERMTQRVERLANAREKLTDNGLLTRFIDMEIKVELLGSLRTRQSKFYLQLSASLVLILTIMMVTTLFTEGMRDSTFDFVMFYVGVALFLLSYFAFALVLWFHLKTKERIFIHELPIR